MKINDYDIILKQAYEVLNADPHYIPALSNLSAVLMDALRDLNWAGFYILRGNVLVVGPFQGKPACIHISAGKGVCGTAAASGRMINVPDVHSFPGHIACDGASVSEIVIPIHKKGIIAGVMDIDSPVAGRFSAEDENGLQKIVEMIEKYIVWEES